MIDLPHWVNNAALVLSLVLLGGWGGYQLGTRDLARWYWYWRHPDERRIRRDLERVK